MGLVARGHTGTQRAQPGPDLLEPPVILVGVQPDPPVLLLAPGELQDQSRDVSAWRALFASPWGQPRPLGAWGRTVGAAQPPCSLQCSGNAPWWHLAGDKLHDGATEHQTQPPARSQAVPR